MKKLNLRMKNAKSKAETELIMEEMEELSKELQKWYAERLDPAKEEEARIKQKILGEALLSKRHNELTLAEQREAVPITSIGYDYVDNALEVTIDPEKYNEKYLKKIRNIVGDEIDLTIAPNGYATHGPLSLEQAKKMGLLDKINKESMTEDEKY